MTGILYESLAVFALLVLLFGYLEYRYKGDIIYVVGRLFTTSKYLVPLVVLPVAYLIFRVIVNFLFLA